MTSKRLSISRVTNGSLTSCWWTLFGKYSSSLRPLTVHWPVPGVSRTRAMACLRRPVAAPGAETISRGTVGVGASPDSVE